MTTVSHALGRTQEGLGSTGMRLTSPPHAQSTEVMRIETRHKKTMHA